MNVFCTWCHAAVVRVFARAKVVMQVFFIRTIYFVMSPPLPLIQVGIPSFTFAKAPFMQMIYIAGTTPMTISPFRRISSLA